MHKKWFDAIKSGIDDLIVQPINNELEELNALTEKYSMTLSDIDKQIISLENELSILEKDLEIINE